MNKPAYPKYKKSGVPWLGEVPDGWEVKGLRYVCHLAYGGSLAAEGREEGEVGVYGSNGQVGTHIFANTQAPVIVVGRKGSFGKLNYSKTPVFAIDTTYFIDATCTKNNLRWLNYALLPLRLDETSKDSAVPGLAREDAYQNKVPVPSPNEQTAIADFLDRETGRIDALMAKKRALVGLLKEKRTALISRTVTRGLPAAVAREFGLEPHTRFRDSGVEWLGEVPEGWEIVPLGYLVRLSGGATPDKSNSEYWDGSIPWVSPKDMKVFRISDSIDHISKDALENSSVSLIPVNAVLIVVRGMILAHSFPVALTTAPVTINQDMKAMTCGKSLSPYFLSWSIAGFAKTFVSFADESAHGTKKLETEKLTRFPLILPPLPEQTAIATYLDRETAKLDKLVEKVEAAITRLQEYRTALITAAVTGKIDVRQEAA